MGTEGGCVPKSALSPTTNRTYDDKFSYYQCDARDNSRTVKTKAPVMCTDNNICTWTECCGTPIKDGVDAGAGSTGMCVDGTMRQEWVNNKTMLYRCAASQLMSAIAAGAATAYIILQ